MRALFIMIAMIIIAGPAQAWEPEQHRVAPDDEESCAALYRSSWDECNCICDPGLVYDPITEYCQDWPFVKPLWDLSADTRTIEPTVPRQCTEQIEEATESSEGAALDQDRDGYSELIDCDDNQFFANPNLNEICDDQIDNNCDGTVDEDECDAVDLPTEEELYSAEEGVDEEEVNWDCECETGDTNDECPESTDESEDESESQVEPEPEPQAEQVLVIEPEEESVPIFVIPPTDLNLIAGAGADWTFDQFLGPIPTSVIYPIMEEGWEFLAAADNDIIMAAQDMDDENQQSLILQAGSHPEDIDHFAAYFGVPELSIHPGQHYLLSAAYTAPTGKELAVRLVDSNNDPITPTLFMSLSASSDWAGAEARIVVPDDAVFDQANLQIGWGQVTDVVELDDIQLHRLP